MTSHAARLDRRPAHHRRIPDGEPAPSAVCLLTGEYPPDPGGVGDYTARLAEALAAQAVAVSVLTAHRPGRLHDHALSSIGDRTAVTVQARVPAWDLRSWPIVARALGRLGPRPLLHIQYQAGAFGLQGAVNLLPLWIRLTVPRARVVTTFHDFRVPYLFPKAGPLRPAANRLLARASHAAIFTDPADLAAAGPGVRGHLIPIGSNIDPTPPPQYDRGAWRRSLGADETSLLIGYFGFLNSSKGVPTVIAALGALAADGRPARLALIGAETGASDPTDLAQARAVREAIDRSGVGHLIATTGRLPPAEVSAALLACDLLALPFRDGASPRRGTLMAGLAHGLPIVSTIARSPAPSPRLPLPLGEGWGEGSDHPLPLRDGEELLLVPPDDPPALARAIVRLADDPTLRARLASNARAAAARIAWPEIARRTAAVYRAAFAEGREARGERRAASEVGART